MQMLALRVVFDSDPRLSLHRLARVAELVDATDLKSVIRKGVRVQVPPRAPTKTETCLRKIQPYETLPAIWETKGTIGDNQLNGVTNNGDNRCAQNVGRTDRSACLNPSSGIPRAKRDVQDAKKC